MKTLSGFAAIAALAGAGVWIAAPAQALTMQECSAKYSAAKAAGTLGEQSWNDFRKAQCGAGEAAAKPAATTVAQAKSEAKSEAKPEAKSEAKSDAKSDDKAKSKKKSAKSEKKEDAKPSGPAVFPAAISPKHAKEKEAKQRQLTCLDQYNANKATNSNGGLKWIQKGGGYYSECNKKLKG
ncbi:MAG: hypothetical protein A4S14_20420 [Proteobacteria bacterium SG_bin9]|nr:MAG: hypothetical protein A4S14_20420 [Proteobacteria bacterium SG_bin9]